MLGSTIDRVQDDEKLRAFSYLAICRDDRTREAVSDTYIDGKTWDIDQVLCEKTNDPGSTSHFYGCSLAPDLANTIRAYGFELVCEEQ